MQTELAERDRDQLADRLRREAAAGHPLGDPVAEVGALEWAEDDVEKSDAADYAPLVDDREPVLVLPLEPFLLALDRVEPLVARRPERRKVRAVLDQHRQELIRIFGGEPADHRGSSSCSLTRRAMTRFPFRSNRSSDCSSARTASSVLPAIRNTSARVA